MRCVIVSHFHWDREWYRTFQAYRARLVDAVDRVLELLDADPGYRFLLDGQTVVLEDYLAIRPERRADLERHIRAHRLAIGPWYVQPDSLLPSGEAHVRNLLAGRRAGAPFGPVSTVGYVPDAFGHPAQLPQILAGFGMGTFVYWRGSGDEIDELGPVYEWIAPDGSAVEATLLRDGYFNAACLPDDAGEAARRLAEVATRLDAGQGGPVLLMNGIDHMLPDAHAGAVAEALARATGAAVVRGVLDDAVGHGRARRRYRGDLTRARLAPLLPGVWSTRMPIKLANRACETALEGWAEPWAALGRAYGLPDERPALALAWRALVQSQAHDSICGCSLDAVADQVTVRLDEAADLAEQTAARLLERLAGRGVERRTPWTVEQEIAVFNPSPHARTDVVRVPLEPYPPLRFPLGMPEVPPVLLAAMDGGFEVDGRPARLTSTRDPRRPRWVPGLEPLDIEFVAGDVPAFGCRRYAVTRAARVDDAVDDGHAIETPEASATVADDGTLSIRLGGREYCGLLAVEDRGDRGDSYDFDAVDGDLGATLVSASWRRRRHPAGIQCLEIRRVFRVPLELDASRERRSAESVELSIDVEVRLAPGVPRVDLVVRADNTARDHRLRLLFPTGSAVDRFRIAATFDVAERSTARPDDARWLHPAPATFPHQGWVGANGLVVVAPGLPEAEVAPDGTIVITLLRAVGWLSRFDLRSRPLPAGPFMPLPGAQVPGVLEARLSLLTGTDPVAARDAELGLRGVLAGPEPVLPPGVSLLALEPGGLVLTALKPAEDGEGIVARVLNPTDALLDAVLRLGVPVAAAVAVRLDEQPADHAVTLDRDTLRFEVPPHATRSVRLLP